MLKEPFQVFLKGSMCANHLVLQICVFVIHHGAYICGGSSAAETPLPHAPGVRMMVVELTPSNDTIFLESNR